MLCNKNIFKHIWPKRFPDRSFALQLSHFENEKAEGGTNTGLLRSWCKMVELQYGTVAPRFMQVTVPLTQDKSERRFDLQANAEAEACLSSLRAKFSFQTRYHCF